MVPAVVIDADQSSCQTHRLNHPGVPVVTYHCQQWKGTMEMVNKYLDRKYWKNAWVHTSNSCKESSTVNFSRRDVHVGRAQTQWFIRLMQRMQPAVWTLENVGRRPRRPSTDGPATPNAPATALCT